MPTGGDGQVYGLELAVDWLVRDDWRPALAYTWSHMSLETAAGSLDTTIEAAEDNLPRLQLSLRSLASIRADLDFDLWLRYVGESAGFDPDTSVARPVAAYWDLDLRLAWRPGRAVEFALVGQNLLDASRLEGCQEFYSTGDREVWRGLYGPNRAPTWYRALLAAACLCLSPGLFGQGKTVDEIALMAACLYHFAKFVEWPASQFATETGPLALCVDGEDPFGRAVDALHGKRVRTRSVQVERRRRGEELAGCHVVFVSASERIYVRPLLDLVEGEAMLTVSDIPGFAALGGIVGLVLQDNRLKFQINAGAAREARLQVSAQLLQLAVDVLGR